MSFPNASDSTTPRTPRVLTDETPATPPTPTAPAEITFASLDLATPIQNALTEEGYVTPTPIQAKTIPASLAGRDVLGCAQTGTGKTAAFALPILHRLLQSPVDKSRRGPVLPRALILSPTRELATQIADSFRAYGRYTGLSGTTIYGGVSQRSQVGDLRRGVDIIVATPGRLQDLMNQGYVDLSAVEIFVLDEADRMLDMGFIKPIREIAASISRDQRQTLLFSATMPREIQHLADSLLTNPVKIAVSPVASAAPKIEQRLYHVGRPQKLGLLVHLINQDNVARGVVFTKTKFGADKLCRRLVQLGITATAIHGNKAQNQRDRALDAFKLGRVRMLVATDVAARGLDVDGISHVFNFELPMEPEAYVHRIGRTARAGAEGIAVSFCDYEEKDLLRQIERITQKRIPTLPLPEGANLTISMRSADAADDDAPTHPVAESAGWQRGPHTPQGYTKRPAFNAGPKVYPHHKAGPHKSDPFHPHTDPHPTHSPAHSNIERPARPHKAPYNKPFGSAPHARPRQDDRRDEHPLHGGFSGGHDVPMARQNRAAGPNGPRAGKPFGKPFGGGKPFGKPNNPHGSGQGGQGGQPSGDRKNAGRPKWANGGKRKPNQN